MGMAEPKPEIGALLTVSPLKMTEPRQVRQVEATSHSSKAITGCYHTVLYFTKSTTASVNDGGGDEQFLAGWAVESLAAVLSEHPLMAGRLRRRENDGGGEGELMEIVANDSGIRMAEARIPMSLSELLGMNRNDAVEVEADLVFWKDVDIDAPDFSPLFYIQVTNFECGGYSIGISCSHLLTEFLIVDQFLNKWSNVHKDIINLIKTHNQQHSNNKPVTPIYYHPRLNNKSKSPPTEIITSSRSTKNNRIQNLIFKVTTSHQNVAFSDEEDEMWKELGVICLEKAEKKLESKQFSMMVTKCGEIIRMVDVAVTVGWRKEEEAVAVEGTTWDDEFGEDEVEFEEGNKAVFVSRWINNGSCEDDDNAARVVVVPSPKHGVTAMIIVSLPV